MTSKGYALAREELIRALTAYSGITTADGAADGSTIVDSNLIGRNDFVAEKTILIMSGAAQYEDKGATLFNTLTGQITLQGTGFSARIMAGTIYRILNLSSVEIDVLNISTKIGTNVDPAGTTTLFAWLAMLFTLGGQGLVYYGEVTAVDLVTQFRVAGLAGLADFGDAYFANTYRVYVVRDADGLGAVPQGEMQPCTAFTSVGGIFTHPAFTAGLAVGDEVLLLHERIAEVADLLADIGDASGSTLGSIYAILGNPAQSFLAMIGYEGATALANKLTAARAALLDEITALRMAELDAANIPADTDPKVMGRSQIFEKSITSPANAGDVNVATITDQPCQIESVIIHADAAQTADMTSCGVFGGAGKVITFIDAASAVQASLDAEDKQVAWTGAVRLADAKTIVISLVGTGATAVDLTITIKYRASVSGGHLA